MARCGKNVTLNEENARNQMKLFSYVVARDFGFAPNPFGGFCTLATCKPDIRSGAKIGNWIVGTGSATNNQQGYLIFSMRVDEICSFDEYWNDPRFQIKKPDLAGSSVRAFGDNIYHLAGKEWIQADSHHSYSDGSTNKLNVARDTKADRVLISNEYSYFGTAAVKIPEKLRNFSGYDLCKTGPGFRSDAPEEMIREFISWNRSFSGCKIKGFPNDWA
jgi:hypothetical protein